MGSRGTPTITTIHYIAHRNVGADAAHDIVRDLLRLFEVAPVTGAGLGFDNFEGAVLHEAGRLSGAAAIVTRDASGFSSVALRVYAPDTLVAALDAAEQA